MNSALSSLGNSYLLLMQGTAMTIKLWLCAALISISIGTCWGILRSSQLRIKALASTLDIVTGILRGIPFYVQLMITYYVIPALFGLDISTFSASVLALGFCSAAYVSQIVRGGINAVPTGQWEAAKVLGYSTFNTLRYVILPQIMRSALPAWTGELDQLLKSTAVISTIGVLELTGAAKNVITQEMNPLTMYTAIACIYLSISFMLNTTSTSLERRMLS